MIICKDVNNINIKSGDKILYVKSGRLEKATVINIGREHLTARKENSSMAKIHNLVCGNKHIIKNDW